MTETLTLVGLIGFFGCLVVLAVRWWLNHPPPAVLGETDLSESLHQVLRWAEDGGRITLAAVDRHAVVVFTKRAALAGSNELEVELTSDHLDDSAVDELCHRWKLLGIPVSGERCCAPRDGEYRSFGIQADLPRDAPDCGEMANAALGALGLRPGDRYRYRFDGAISSDGLRQDAIAAARRGRATAPHEWQASLFDRLLKIVKGRS